MNTHDTLLIISMALAHLAILAYCISGFHNRTRKRKAWFRIAGVLGALAGVAGLLSCSCDGKTATATIMSISFTTLLVAAQFTRAGYTRTTPKNRRLVLPPLDGLNG